MSTKIKLWMWSYHYGPVVLLFGLNSLFLSLGWLSMTALTLPWTIYQIYHTLPVMKPSGAEMYNVVIVGSGIAGLVTAAKLKELGIRFEVLEKGSHLGGTWWWNTFPGAACDVPSHLYSISFFPNPWWTRVFATTQEIQSYLLDFASYFKLHSHIKYNQHVTTCKWDDSLKKWNILTIDGKEITANFIISACGHLHAPKTPTFEGLESFKGAKFHSGQWDHSAELVGKAVGIVGTGASAVQIVPELAKRADQLHVFQRTPTWVVPKTDPITPRWQRLLFTFMPCTLTLYRWYLFCMNEKRFPAMVDPDPVKAHELKAVIAAYHAFVLKDPELIRKLTPDYNVGCKRITPSVFYLEAFAKPNVHLESGKIVRVTPSGIQTEEGHTALDTIVFATGFDRLRSFNAFEVFGTDATKAMSEELGDSPSAYLGAFIPGYPNFLTMAGPNTSSAHNSIIFSLECQSNQVVNYLVKLIQSGHKSMEIRAEHAQEHTAFIQENMPKHVFSSCFNEAYQGPKGSLWPMWPFSMVYFWWRMLECDLTLFKLKN